GGQVGDTGTLTSSHCTLTVTDTKKTKDNVYLHLVTVDDGDVGVGDILTARIDSARRAAIRRSHSSVHLLQAALRKHLGTHVEQSGSYVDEHRVRFDFTHFAALTPEQLAEVEKEVNAQILAGLPVETVVTDLASAEKAGAMALFGEKYHGDVRMVKMGGFSLELCGGTHVENTSRIGLFRILSEGGIAAGVRRIEAVTGTEVLALLDGEKALADKACKALGVTNRSELADKAAALAAELKELKKTVEKLNAKLDAAQISSLESSMEPRNGFRLLFAKLDGMTPDRLRAAGDMLKDKYPDSVSVLCTVSDGKVMLSCSCGKDAVAKGAHAGNVLKKISPILGGGGGGRPDCASSGGRDPSKLPEAEKAFREMF
ncbi:MAG: alanine--tRNA ligase, partial [Clostridia bacterium]|nr:alanine--tRNA ligase [Clostridia bacterium]